MWGPKFESLAPTWKPGTCWASSCVCVVLCVCLCPYRDAVCMSVIHHSKKDWKRTYMEELQKNKELETVSNIEEFLDTPKQLDYKWQKTNLCWELCPANYKLQRNGWVSWAKRSESARLGATGLERRADGSWHEHVNGLQFRALTLLCPTWGAADRQLSRVSFSVQNQIRFLYGFKERQNTGRQGPS